MNSTKKRRARGTREQAQQPPRTLRRLHCTTPARFSRGFWPEIKLEDMSEPSVLARGKRFHRAIQAEWLASAKDGRPIPERSIARLNGHNGRMDILVEELGDFVSIVEIKSTDWDMIRADRVNSYVRRQIRQIWSYVEVFTDRVMTSVCPGVIFPSLPHRPGLAAMVERLFNEEGIQVAWHDEDVDSLRRRMAESGGPD